MKKKGANRQKFPRQSAAITDLRVFQQSLIEPHARHRGKLHTGGTLDDNLLLLDPKSEALERGVGNYFGLIMHELVGHGHPASPNAVRASEQGANIIGQAFGLSSIHDHLAKPGKPGGGYRGYPVTLRPQLPPVPKKYLL